MIEHFIITVLVIYGIHGSTREGMIFERVRGSLWWVAAGGDLKTHRRIKIADSLTKALFNCTPCMASVYGTISYFIIVCFSLDSLIYWPVWVFSISGFNYILNKFMNK